MGITMGVCPLEFVMFIALICRAVPFKKVSSFNTMQWGTQIGQAYFFGHGEKDTDDAVVFIGRVLAQYREGVMVTGIDDALQVIVEWLCWHVCPL